MKRSRSRSVAYGESVAKGLSFRAYAIALLINPNHRTVGWAVLPRNFPGWDCFNRHCPPTAN